MLIPFLSLWLVAPCLCQEPPAADEAPTVRVGLVVILASSQDYAIDPKLARLAREIRKREPQLTHFQIVRESCEPIRVGTPHAFPLLEDQVTSVLVVHGADAHNRVCLQVKPPDMGTIKYTTACGKFFPIVTPYVTKERQTLILALMVKTCK